MMENEVKRSNKLPFVLNDTYVPTSWPTVGEIPQAPRFDKIRVSIQQQPKSSSSTFVSGMMVEVPGGGGNVLFRAEDNHSAMAAVASEADAAEGEAEQPERISLAPEELEYLLEEARQKGRFEAEKEIGEVTANQITELASRWNIIFQDVSTQLKDELQTLESKSVDLAVEVIAKFLRKKFARNEELIKSIFREAFSLIDPEAVLEISVSEEDYDLWKALPELVALQSNYRFVLKVDPLVRSGCIVRTHTEVLDFDVDAGLERVLKSL